MLGMVRGYYDGYDREIHEVYQYDMERNNRPADYGRADLWVSRPDKAAAQAARADVFMVLPTVNMNRWDADNEDVTSLKDALRFVKTFNMEKGIFGDSTAVYAPYYRQVTFGTYALQDKGEQEKYMEVARDDVRAAFRWYLENCHVEGRPIVLFGYSQGAKMVKDLLTQYGQDARLSGSLAAAYVIGESMTQADLNASPWLKMAQGEADTGVIVSYECMGQAAAERIAAEEAAAAAGAQKPAAGQAAEAGQPAAGQGTEAGQPAAPAAGQEQPSDASLSKALSINPLNWKTDSTVAPKELNLGYVVTDTYGNVKEEVPAFCGAYIDEKTGILVATGIDDPAKYAVKGVGILPDGSFHLYDLAFFYNNLKQNMAKRIAAFLGEEVELTVIPEEPAAAPEEPAAVPEVPAAVPEEPAAAPEEPATAPKEPAAVPEQPAATPGEPAAAPEQPAAAPEEQPAGGTAPAAPSGNTETTDQEDAGGAGTEEASVNTIVRR